MNTAHLEPLPARLHAIHLALEHTDNLKPFGAHLERDGTLVVLHTARGPAYVKRATLPAIVARMGIAAPPAPVVREPAPPAKRANKPEPLPTWSAHRIPLGCAPKRAVGNFTTRELRERTIADLKGNLREATRAGNDKLVRVMIEALEVATKRPVDVNGVIQR